ncbi:hypothetical protein EDB83DRAFT_2316371 [Lactarius deliciosus]|nr:hypothetical protein EDB83DRAFT_2316371 [Lactarius deliciosus]
MAWDFIGRMSVAVVLLFLHSAAGVMPSSLRIEGKPRQWTKLRQCTSPELNDSELPTAGHTNASPKRDSNGTDGYNTSGRSDGEAAGMIQPIQPQQSVSNSNQRDHDDRVKDDNKATTRQCRTATQSQQQLELVMLTGIDWYPYPWARLATGGLLPAVIIVQAYTKVMVMVMAWVDGNSHVIASFTCYMQTGPWVANNTTTSKTAVIAMTRWTTQ